MHAELRWFVFHTLQRRSPQPGDRGRAADYLTVFARFRVHGDMKLSNDFSGALRTFAYFMASGSHYMLEDVEYLTLYGEDPGRYRNGLCDFRERSRT